MTRLNQRGAALGADVERARVAVFAVLVEANDLDLAPAGKDDSVNRVIGCALLCPSVPPYNASYRRAPRETLSAILAPKLRADR